MKELLVEKYRPQNLEDYIFPNKGAKDRVEKWLSEKEIPNILLVSGAGQGKSTLSNIIISELGVDPSDVKRINASLTNGIGFIREELEPWLTKAPSGEFKVVQLEEADQLSKQAQKALRQITEEYSDYVRFILTANFGNKIIDPLHSRFQTVDMDGISEDDIIELVINIIEKEEIVVEDEEILLEHINLYSPDLRKIINSIDESTNADKGLSKPTGNLLGNGDVDDWVAVWESEDEIDPLKLLELSEAVDNTNFEVFYQTMYEKSDKLPDEVNGVIMISKYLDRAKDSANQRLHLDACIYHIFFVEEE